MNILRAFLAISTLAIYIITIIASVNNGINWPAVAVGDLLQLDWRSQFDTDFLVHLLLLATWVIWREGATARGYVFGLLSIVMGGMFSFPYILYATFRAQGKPQALLLGIHAKSQRYR